MNRAAFHQLVFTHLRQFFPELPDWNSAVRFLRLQGESMNAFDQLGDYTDLYHAVLNEAFKRYGDRSLNVQLIESIELEPGDSEILIGEPFNLSSTKQVYTHIYDPETATWKHGADRRPLIKLDMNHHPYPTERGEPQGYFVTGSTIRIAPAPARAGVVELTGYGYPYFKSVDEHRENDLLIGPRPGTEDSLARYVVSRLIDPINYDLGAAIRTECETLWEMDRQRNSWNRLKRATRRLPLGGAARRREIPGGGWF